MDRIAEMQEKRSLYLKALYEKTNASELLNVGYIELGADLGFTDQDTERIAEYLGGCCTNWAKREMSEALASVLGWF